MKALVFHGPDKIGWEVKPKPQLKDATDAIVAITKTTICGTDLHILHGDVPEVPDGLILGHEGTGIVKEVGTGVSNFQAGDKVLISCITSCGKCESCRNGIYSHCENGGWVLGHTIDGTQAEFVRIPYADFSLYHAPKLVDEDVLVMLSDILPTGFECGVLNGHVKPGDVVAIIGSGPIGIAALLTAQLYSPSEIIMVDPDRSRLAVALKLGATKMVRNDRGDPVAEIMKNTGGKGVDVAIEAVGIPATFDICQEIIANGGHIANVGVHGKSVSLHLEKLWSKNVTITTRLVDTVTTNLLLKMVAAGKLKPDKLITHHYALHDILQAYETFRNAAREKALKIILTNWDSSGIKPDEALSKRV